MKHWVQDVARLAAAAGALIVAASARAETSIKLDLGASSPEQVGSALKMIIVLTVLSVAPAILLATTSFLRIAVVFSFLRSALGVQGAPPNQVLMGLALFLTVAIMAPVGTRVWNHALGPYLDGQMQGADAFAAGVEPMREFMLRQTRPEDVSLFYELNQLPLPAAAGEVKLYLLVPAFIISELRTSFEMGFLIFVPFVMLDLVVATVLMSMGMVMLPPALISLPLKIMLFVVADGWSLLVGSLVRSFS